MKTIHYGSELYQLCATKKNPTGYCLVDELGWINETDFCIWVNYLWLWEFLGFFKEIFGNGVYDDGGFSVQMQEDHLCVNLSEALDGYLSKEDLEHIFPRNKYMHRIPQEVRQN